MSRLATHEYWEERYQQDPEPFDWLQRYSTCREFRESLKKQLRPTDTTLVVGAGSSRLPEELFADGHTKLTAVDWSSTCVSQLKERYARSQNLKIETAVMDARRWTSTTGFDACIDKALLDAVLCGGDDARRRARGSCSPKSRVCKASSRISPRLDRAARRPIAATEAAEFNWKVTSHPIANRRRASPPSPSRRVGAGGVVAFCTCARGGRGG